MGWLKDKIGADKSTKKTTYSDEDLEKYTGKTRTELEKFAANTPGVAGNQKAGDITAGGANGFYGAVYSTYDVNTPLKFPREQAVKEDK